MVGEFLMLPGDDGGLVMGSGVRMDGVMEKVVGGVWEEG